MSVKFNETFSDYRDRQGKLKPASYIEPDLRVVSDDGKDDREIQRSDNDIDHGSLPQECDADTSQVTQQPTRQRREIIPRQFLLPGTHSKRTQSQLSDTYLRTETNVRKQQYLH